MSRVRHFGICVMAKIKCFSIPGMQLWFYSNDHEPPHFHAKRNGAWEYKVQFLEPSHGMFNLISAAKKTSMSKADRELLRKMVERHRIDILREWEQKVIHL